MVFRAVIAGSVLVLGSWCSGQEAAVETAQAVRAHQSWVEPVLESEEVEIDGQLVRFELYLFAGYDVSVRAGDDHTSVGQRVPGHVLVAVSEQRVEAVWASTRRSYTASAHVRSLERHALWWDDDAQRLWFAWAEATNGDQSYLEIWSFDISRDPQTHAFNAEATSHMKHTIGQERCRTCAISHACAVSIDAIRFTETDEGPALRMYHISRPATVLRLSHRMMPVAEVLVRDDSLAELEAAIASGRARPTRIEWMRPWLRFDRETEQVELDGHGVRFVVHAFNGYETGSGSRQGRVLPSDFVPRYAVSAVPEGKPEEAAALWWGGVDTRMPEPGEHGGVGKQMAIWWDGRASQLWIAVVATRGESRERFSVCRLTLDWDVPGETIRIIERAETWRAMDPPMLIVRDGKRRLRFVRREGGEVVLQVVHDDGDTRDLDLAKGVHKYPDKYQLLVSGLLEEAIRENLAERASDDK